MAMKINAFLVRETGKNYIVSPVAEYISIRDMLKNRKAIPTAEYLKISKKLVQSMRITHPCMQGNSFLTVRGVGESAVDTVKGFEFIIA